MMVLSGCFCCRLSQESGWSKFSASRLTGLVSALPSFHPSRHTFQTKAILITQESIATCLIYRRAKSLVNRDEFEARRQGPSVVRLYILSSMEAMVVARDQRDVEFSIAGARTAHVGLSQGRFRPWLLIPIKDFKRKSTGSQTSLAKST